MVPKRAARNAACWLLATLLILRGHVKRAKHESQRDGVITSIYFHNPGRRLFTKVISWLESNGYTFISADQLIDILNKRAVCPKGAVWISLDDGWKGNLDHVIPVAEEHNVPITIFVYTAGVEEGSFWWEDLKRYANRLPAELRQIEAIIGQSEDTRKQALKLIAQANAQSGVRRAV